MITGANGGVGRVLVAHFADRGWHVYAGVRTHAAGDELGRGRRTVTPVLLDVLDEDSRAEAARTVAEHLQRAGLAGLGGLVNNAGKSTDGPLELTPAEELVESFALNVVGPVAVAQAFLPLLRPVGGRIVNMGGAAGRVAMPMYGALSASKAALDSVSDVLRMELIHQGVGVSYIEPGGLDTSFFHSSAQARLRDGYAGDATTQAIYASAIKRAATAMSAMKPGQIQPVAEAIERALTAKKPSPRYVVGRDAKTITRVVRRLPTHTRDKAIMRAMDLKPDAFVPRGPKAAPAQEV